MTQGAASPRRFARLAGNLASLLTSDVLNRATVFALYALVARYLGAASFGRLALALALFYVFQVFAVAGLRTLMTREVARDRTRTGAYLLAGGLAALGFAALSFVGLLAFVAAMGYEAGTRDPILLLGLALAPFALAQVCEGVFQAWERMHLIAAVSVPVNLLRIGLIVVLLEQGADVTAVIGVLAASHVVVALVEGLLAARLAGLDALRLDFGLARELSRRTLPFLGMDGTIAIWDTLSVLLLAWLTSEREVGLYSSAAQTLVPANMVLLSLALTAFPIMCRMFDLGADNLKRSFATLGELLLVVALPSAVGLFLLADRVLVLLYGAEFAAGAPALQVLVWGLIPQTLVRAFGQVQLASLRERVTLRIVLINTVISLVLGLLLVSRFGIIGAAVATVASQLAGCVQHYLSLQRVLAGVSLLGMAWKPVVATGVMAGFTLLAGPALNTWLLMAAAAVLYAATWLGITVLQRGPAGVTPRINQSDV
jgi:O-antigen/teichoic acid export membrane protein